MAEQIFGFPFDAEVFIDLWRETPDPVKTAFLDSGVMVSDKSIAEQLSGRGNLFTLPFYDLLDGMPQNYDGQTDITPSEVSAGAQTGVAYGRSRAFFARNFMAELSGGDPMGHIAASIGRYWDKQNQKQIINILNAVFGINADTQHAEDFLNGHIADYTGGGEYLMGDTDLNDLATMSLGDNKGAYRMAIMHSAVARNLENRQLLEYWKYTDKEGVQRPMALAAVNGYTVLVDDSVPVSESGDLKTYTTYLLGEGVLWQADGRVDMPVETTRDALKNGGQDTLITRVRQAIHPNGFSFSVPKSGWTESPTDAQLGDSANWSIQFDPKSIPLACIITNG